MAVCPAGLPLVFRKYIRCYLRLVYRLMRVYLCQTIRWEYQTRYETSSSGLYSQAIDGMTFRLAVVSYSMPPKYTAEIYRSSALIMIHI